MALMCPEALISSDKKPRHVAFTSELPGLFNSKVDKKALWAKQER